MANEDIFDDPVNEVDPIIEEAFGDSDQDNDFDVLDNKEETLDSDDLSFPEPEEVDSLENIDDYTHSPKAQSDSREPISTISDIQFPSLSQEDTGKKVEVDVFSNIPVNLSVELGRSKISLKEVFELTEGSIIELERLVGEPLDLVVNGQIIAQGEVVAIDNNYGLRITNVVSKTGA